MQFRTVLVHRVGQVPVRVDHVPLHVEIDLAVRLAIEVESIPDNFQKFNMLSYHAHGKFSTEKARRILGYTPLERLESYYKRVP